MDMVLPMSHLLISSEVIGLLGRLPGQMLSGDRRFWDGQVVRKDVDVNAESSLLKGNWKSCNLACMLMLSSLLSIAVAGRVQACTVMPMPMPSDLVDATRNDLR